MAPLLLHETHSFHDSPDRVKFLVFWVAIVLLLIAIELMSLGLVSLFR
jgi:hypothetical protein